IDNIQLAASAGAPEIDVSAGGSAIADGGTIAFGSTTQGTAVTKTITVTNSGTGTLTLTPLNPVTMPAGFSLVSNLGSTSLAAGQSTTFVIQLNATAAGSFSGTIQLANNDSNENPYDLTLTGSVTSNTTAVMQIVDNGDPGNVLTGGWQKTSGVGYL